MQKKQRSPRRNRIMATIAVNDPMRYRQRTVESETGKGRKDRPRQKKFSPDDFSIFAN